MNEAEKALAPVPALRPEDYPVGASVHMEESDARMLVSVATEIAELHTELGAATFEFEQRKAALLAQLEKTQGKFTDLSIEVGKKLSIPVGRGGQDWLFMMETQSFRRTR